MNGFLAWRKMCQRYSPKTPAKALMAMVDVMSPKRVSDVLHLTKAIDDWELKASTLEREFEEKLSERMKIALVLSMAPLDIQDLMYQHVDNVKDYAAVRDKIKGIAQNRVSRSLPTPMDTSVVDRCGEWAEDGAADEDLNDG